MFENTDASDDKDHKPALDVMMIHVHALNFDVSGIIIDGSEFVLPQRRKRMYLKGFRRPGRGFHVESYDSLFKNIETLINASKLKGPSILDTPVASASLGHQLGCMRELGHARMSLHLYALTHAHMF